MIYSMTGYGKAESHHSDLMIIVEVRSLNSRFFDLSLKVPQHLVSKESSLADLIKKHISRGKVAVTVSIRTQGGLTGDVNVNIDAIQTYKRILNEAIEKCGLDDTVRLEHILKLDDVFVAESAALDEKTWKNVSDCTEAALKSFDDQRRQEGTALQNDIIARLDQTIAHVDEIEGMSESAAEEQMQLLRERLQKLLQNGNIEPQRLDLEIALLADKADVTEEIVRFRSHANLFRQTLANKDRSIGKKLNFLTQELHREVNTMGSKTTKVEVTHKVVEIKDEIEKMREQIQNIE